MTNENENTKPEFTEDAEDATVIGLDGVTADVKRRLLAMNQEDDEIVLEPVEMSNGSTGYRLRVTDFATKVIGEVFDGVDARGLLRANALARSVRSVFEAFEAIADAGIGGYGKPVDLTFVSGLASSMAGRLLTELEVEMTEGAVLETLAMHTLGSRVALSLADERAAEAARELAKSEKVERPESDKYRTTAEGECACPRCEMARAAGVSPDELGQLLRMASGMTTGEA